VGPDVWARDSIRGQPVGALHSRTTENSIAAAKKTNTRYESACWHYGVGCAELQTRFLGALFVIQQVMMPLKPRPP